MAAPAGQEHVRVARLPHRAQRVLALPLPREAAQQHERRRPLEALPGPRVRADQQRHPLDLGEPAHVEEHRAARAERLEVRVGVGHAARLARLVPAERLLHQPAAPVREPLLAGERTPVEPLRVEAVRRPHHPRRVHVEERRARAGRRRARGPAAARSPRAQRRIRSAQLAACSQPGGGPSSISRSISSSVPCRCPTRGTPGKARSAASLIGVRWCRCSTSAAPASAAPSCRSQVETRRS